MTLFSESPTFQKLQSLSRLAKLSSASHKNLEVTPEMAGLLAEYLQEALATAEDQAWFWSDTWQAGEREAEADIVAGNVKTFDTMESLIDDLGWPR